MLMMWPPFGRIASTAAREPYTTPSRFASTISRTSSSLWRPSLVGAEDAGVVDPDLQGPARGGIRGGGTMRCRVADVERHRPHALAEQLGSLLGGLQVTSVASTS